MADALASGVKELLTSIAKDLLTSIGSGTLSNELKLLKGVEKDVQKLITDFRTITAVLVDAEKRSVKDDDVQIWVDQLKDVCYEIEDVLDEWRTKTVLQQQQHQPPESASCLQNKVRSLWTSSHLPQFAWNRDIALKIKGINQRLDEVVNQKNTFNFKLSKEAVAATEPERPKTTSFVDVSRTHGRDSVKQSLIGRLLSESSQEEHNLTVTAIVGMGGIGKTTLAQLALIDESVKKHFDKQIWVCVSQPFNVIQIARAILEGLHIKDRDLTELESMLQVISEALDNQRFLLVLDDVWNEDYKKWEPLRNCLKNGAQGSKILVTTRKKRVADIMESANPIPLEKLSAEVCWSIFSQIAFLERSKEECKVLEETGRKMSERCKGLPLAAKVLGSLMRFRRSRVEWQNVLDSDLWELEEANNDIYPVFMLSYYDLPSPMKRCFTYCAIFPEDHVLGRNRLIQFWMANGFLRGREVEITGEEYIESMAMRSLFQDLERDPHSGRIQYFKMHDLVRDFALRVSRNECGAMEVYEDEPMKQELPSYAKLRHVRLICKGGDHISRALSKSSISGLRTLMSTDLEGPNAEKKVLGGLFCDLTSLRTLELKDSDIEELPLEIGKLMHLRYLGLEYNRRLKALPETACDLINLQILNLNYWRSIKRLPRGIGKLLNLRHLELAETGIKKLPKGVGELTSLRTLSGFRIECSPPKKKSGDGSSSSNNNNREEDEDEEEEYFGIGDLEKLNCLQGDLSLNRLADVVDVDEAKRAGLKKKKNLQSLYLEFGTSGPFRSLIVEEYSEEERARRAEWQSLIVEALEPPPSLEKLEIEDYEGTELPSWITSLSRLEILTFSRCHQLKRLPRGIGRLLNLRHLEILDTGIKKLPKGIGELTSLRTLWKVDCRNNNNREEEEEEYFGMGDLEKLNCLELLFLKGLGNAGLLDDVVVVGDAKRAGLKNKKNLRILSLDFDASSSIEDSEEAAEERRKRRHLLIAEALLEEEAPPPHLEELVFISYRGTELPRWIASLPGLKFLRLLSCPNLKELPGDFFERLPPQLHRVYINECPTLAEYCRRRMTEDSALARLFVIRGC